ncbi:MAG: hypothetical protein WCM76_08050 [Bacteroidota bacterium]
MKRNLLILAFLFAGINMYAQDTVVSNGHAVFYYPNKNIASEGFMYRGKPDGYWKTYYQSGILKSEGNRKNFLLDSLWRFYSDSGKVVLEINYSAGLKNGIRRTFQKQQIIEENFINDVKQGFTFYYYPDKKIKSKVNFIDGREEGTGREYDHDGNVITLIDYKHGYNVGSENINRYRDGLKHGPWKEFYYDEILKSEGNWSYGKKDGYFKEYGKDGNLLSIRKYLNDVEITDAPELASLQVKTDYYKNGKPKIVASYKDGIPEGVRREYAQDGQILKSYIFKNGVIVGEGIVDEQGLKQGKWKEFYDSGEQMSAGTYKDGKKQGEWLYYFKDGKQEQKGTYNAAGKIDGIWRWYFESGNLRKEEAFSDGLPDGPMKELSDSGSIIISGNFVDGEEDGEWIYKVGDDTENGSYVNGKRDGLWKQYSSGILYFDGSYVDGNANGDHIWYYENGKIREKGSFVMGKKEGNWSVFNEDGTKLITITFEDGVEKTIDGSKIDNDIEK